MKRFLLVIALLFLPASLSASDFFYAQTAAGSNNGTSCANAFAYNDGTNGWNAAAKQVAGNTLHVCGTFTGSANQAPLITFSHSGSSGSPIILKFESGSIMQAPYFSNSEGGVPGGAITLGNGQSWITVDGSSLTGTIQNTANGSSLANQQPSTGVSGFGCNHCTVTGLNIINMYVNVTNSGTLGDNSVVRAIDFNGPNWTISNNVIHDCGWCVFDSYANNDTNANIFGNDISHMGHGIMYAAASAVASISPALILHDNHIHDTVNWQASGCPFHQDGLHTFGVTGSSMDGIYVYNNKFDGDWGTCPTGFVFVEAAGSGTPSNMKNSFWFNNVGVVVNPGFINTNGWFGVSSGTAGGVTKIYNNTILGLNATDNSACFVLGNLASVTFQNNVVSPCGSPVRIDSSTIAALSNNFYGPSCQNGGNCFVFNGAFTGSFAGWKTATGGDANSIQSNTPKLNTDGTPQSGSPVIGLGANLTSISTGSLLPLSSTTSSGNSIIPVSRPASGAWDSGAFQFSNIPNVSTPTFSPVAGNYGTAQSVTISSSTAGATICYTTDGSAPTANEAGTCTHGTTYTTPVSVSVSETLKAIGSLSGDTDSSVGTAAYLIGTVAATPTFSPVAGTYATTQTVTISTTSGSVICYNTTGSPATNGATGCSNGTLYTGPVSVVTSETLFAIAGGSTFIDSSVGSAAYTIGTTAATPTFSPVAGTYGTTQTVTISSTTGTAIICFNTTGSPATNGSTGCTTGTKYTGPVSVAATETLFAVAGGTGFNDSSIATAAYTIGGGGGTACSAGAMPQTINSNWTERGCNAISAGGGESDCTISAIDGSSKCRSKVLGLFSDTAVNVNDTITSFCDDDYDFGSGTTVSSFAIVDNALGSGTVNSSNSGGNSLIVRATGSNFASGWVGGTVLIAGVAYTVTAFTDTSHITVSGNTGTITGAAYVAGNLFSKIPQTDFDFVNVGNHVRGNYFYVAGSTYAKASGYQATCQSLTAGGNGVSDMDMSVLLFRQSGAGKSAGVDASAVWSNVTTPGTCTGGPAGLGCSLGSPSVTRSLANDLVISVQQQNNQTEGATFTAGTALGCDNDGTTNVFSGWYYYSSCSSSAATGSISATAYAGAGTNGTSTLIAFKPTVSNPTANAPTFSPVAGTYTGTQSVTLSSSSVGAIICFNTTGSPATNGTTGCTTGTLYTGPVSVLVSETIFAVAGGTGFTDSTVASAAYTINVAAATPTFTPVAGTYHGVPLVTLVSSSGSVICYNTTGSPATNGTTGCTTGTLYTGPIRVSTSQTIFAVAGGTGFIDSTVGSAAYVIQLLAAPASSPGFMTYLWTPDHN